MTKVRHMGRKLEYSAVKFIQSTPRGVIKALSVVCWCTHALLHAYVLLLI